MRCRSRVAGDECARLEVRPHRTPRRWTARCRGRTARAHGAPDHRLQRLRPVPAADRRTRGGTPGRARRLHHRRLSDAGGCALHSGRRPRSDRCDGPPAGTRGAPCADSRTRAVGRRAVAAPRFPPAARVAVSVRALHCASGGTAPPRRALGPAASERRVRAHRPELERCPGRHRTCGPRPRELRVREVDLPSPGVAERQDQRHLPGNRRPVPVRHSRTRSTDRCGCSSRETSAAERGDLYSPMR